MGRDEGDSTGYEAYGLVTLREQAEVVFAPVPFPRQYEGTPARHGVVVSSEATVCGARDSRKDDNGERKRQDSTPHGRPSHDDMEEHLVGVLSLLFKRRDPCASARRDGRNRIFFTDCCGRELLLSLVSRFPLTRSGDDGDET